MKTKQIRRVINNPRTKELLDFVENTKKLGVNQLVSPQFFHPSHNDKDRELIVKTLIEVYNYKVKIKRFGREGVHIEFN